MTPYAPPSPPPTGLARRPRRRSEGETERRMLDAAMAMIDATGLTVSLDHLSFEDIIRDADVSRSAAYRRWPHKDLFFSDLVKELAEAAIPSPSDNAAIEALVHDTVREHPDWLRTPDRRRALLVELIRRAAELDFDTLYGSPQWRTYLALHATFMSLADGALRDEVQQILARSQDGFISRVATAWEVLARLFGFTPRPDTGASFETLATLASALVRGLVIMSLSAPQLAESRHSTMPFGAGTKEEWSLSALGLAGLAASFFEADDEIWDAEKAKRVLEELQAVTVPLPAP